MDVFHDIRVLDLTGGVAGPLVGMFFADFGADVVKVEGPEGDPARSRAGFATWNRGKRGVVVPADDPARVAWLGRQVAGADVLIVTGGNQLARYGLDRDELLSRHGRLVVVELPPYLPGYTPWSGGAESAALLATLGGQAWRQSSMSGHPVDSVYPTTLYCQGLWATVCTVAALLERESSGCGQRVTVSGVNGLMQLLTSAFTVNPDAPDVSTAVGTGGRHPAYTRFLTGDGRWIASGALGPKFETALLHVLGLSEMLDDERLEGNTRGLVQPENLAWAKKKISDAFLRASADEWVEALQGAGIPCVVVADRSGWLDHPQVRAIGMREVVQDPERGEVVMPGVPIRMTASPGRVRGPAPMLGQHSDTIEDWSGRTGAPARGPVRPGPLHGRRVVITGAFVATPFAGLLLAELGADVIKVEPTGGDPFRDNAYAVNRGLRSLAIDLRSPAGLAAFHQVVAGCDAVVDGLRPGVTTRLGIDRASLLKANPALVVVSMSAYGDIGPMSRLGGVDVVVQGLCGMMRAEGGDGEPAVNTIAVNDNATAAMSALAVTLGLLHRERTGEGQQIHDSLIATATYLQSGELTTFASAPDPTIGRDDFPGPGQFDRLYEVKDRWIRIAPRPQGDTGRRLGAALGIQSSDLVSRPEEALTEAFARMSSDEAMATLRTADVPAVIARKIGEVIRDPRLLEAEFLHVVGASDGRSWIAAPGRYATFSRTARSGPLIPPGVGEHSRAILADAGLAADVVEELVATGLVTDGVPLQRAIATAYR
ncbi:hypothetical protein GCM10009836_36320 [Pseudonocardia ailaonensis]|uniref:CoA transferase n=1 Tax=Pseudonocardia ailaonensis TaxID=367279 RepID=A0ABN2N536_9PSEU